MPKASKGELSRCENRPPSAGKWPHPQNEGKLLKLRGCADGPPSAAEWPLLRFSLTEKYKSQRFVEAECAITKVSVSSRREGHFMDFLIFCIFGKSPTEGHSIETRRPLFASGRPSKIAKVSIPSRRIAHF